MEHFGFYFQGLGGFGLTRTSAPEGMSICVCVCVCVRAGGGGVCD